VSAPEPDILVRITDAVRDRLAQEPEPAGLEARARETAEILARHLTPPPDLQEVDWLAPTADPGMAQDAVESATEPLMLVGHLPHMARLASLLLTGNPNREVVRFRNATVVCLERAEDDWVLLWALGPDLVAPSA